MRDPIGRDMTVEESAWAARLEAAGYDFVKIMYARMTPEEDPAKFIWTQHWLAGRDKAMREAFQARNSRHEKITRRIARGALVVAFAALLVSAGAWLFPRKNQVAIPASTASPSATPQPETVQD